MLRKTKHPALHLIRVMPHFLPEPTLQAFSLAVPPHVHSRREAEEHLATAITTTATTTTTTSTTTTPTAAAAIAASPPSKPVFGKGQG